MAKKTASKSASSTRKALNGKKLVIVESPAKAKTINRYLGDDYIVLASMGHVRDLPRRQISVDIEKDFEPTYEIVDDRKKVLAELKKYASKAPEIYLATDLDREGEAIAWHLAETLGASEDRIRRVVFNEITLSAIQEAFKHPRGVEMNRVNAQQARRILDRIVGYEISPLLWKKVATGLSAGRVQSVAVRLIVDREKDISAFVPDEYWKFEAIFSRNLAESAGIAGQWQDFMAQRDAKQNPPTRDTQLKWLSEHESFRAELTHWRGEKAELGSSEQTLEIARAIGLAIDEVVKSDNPSGKGPEKTLTTIKSHIYEADGRSGAATFSVTDLKEKESLSRPPKPFTTASLQQAASTQLRFSASRTMRVAQQLYEGVNIPGEGSVGLITYMRTDSLNLSNDAISTARKFIGDNYGDRYLPGKPNRYVAAGRAQEAHEAIRPSDAIRTPQSLAGCMNEAQLKLYTLIWKRFIACQMTPAIWSVTDAAISADTPDGVATFRAVGRRLVFDGFMKASGVVSRGDQILPHITTGDHLAPLELSPQQKFTQPPPRFTEASLVRALEAEGIGRPSTYASIIQTIQDRGYVELLERSFHATEVGIKVTDKLMEFFQRVMDLGFTAHMENQFDRIESESLDWVQVLREFYDPFSKNLEKAREEMTHAKAESEPSEYTCPDCSKPMVYRWSKSGRYLACEGYPECSKTFPVDKDGKKVEQKIAVGACPQCGGDMLMRRSRFGAFLGCMKYPECRGTLACNAEGVPLKVVKEKDLEKDCPICGGRMLVKRKGRRAFLGCNNYPECDATEQIPEDVQLEAPPKAPPKPTGVTCPKCGKKELVIRQGPRGEFVACSGFPRCRNSLSMDILDQVKQAAAAGEDVQAVIDAARAAKKSAKKTTKKKAKKKAVKKTKKAAKKTAKKTAKKAAKKTVKKKTAKKVADAE